MKKIVSIVLLLLLLGNLTAFADTTYTDVKKTDWFYSQVMTMTEKGLFVGKGNNLFCPNDTMTKAEFITVVMRILYPNADFTVEEGQPWWQGAYDMALAGLITQDEFPVSTIEQTISRQEMALVSSKALMMRGETFFITEDLHKKIPDYNQVGKEYRTYVEMAYSMGILCGVDTKGTFAPLQTLTRAEGATVLHRLIRKDKRLKNSTSNDNQTETPDTQGAITIYEGQQRSNRVAKEGDIFIKKDGTQIVLKKGSNGILGEGQGVAPDVGLYAPMTASKIEKSGDYMRENMGTVSTGHDSIQEYFINPLTGEGHWASEWTVICNKTDPMLKGIKGTTWNEVSPCKNFVWKGTEWQPLAQHPEVYDAVLGH